MQYSNFVLFFVYTIQILKPFKKQVLKVDFKIQLFLNFALKLLIFFIHGSLQSHKDEIKPQARGR